MTDRDLDWTSDTPAPYEPRPSLATGVRVKICGITSPHDALVAQAAGADAIGMIFAPRSKRVVDRQRAADIVGSVGPFLTTVGVFVDADLDEVIDLAGELRLGAVQLHGSEGPAYAAAVAPLTRVIRALPFTLAPTPAAVADYPADAFLLDAAAPGSGEVFDWRRAAAWRGDARLILAGGLTPHNVAAAIAALQPWAVDVASGVESAPGIKDPEAVRSFIAVARSVTG